MSHRVNLEDISGIGSKTAQRLKDAGISTVQNLAEISIQELLALDIKGIGKATAEKYILDAKKAVQKDTTDLSRMSKETTSEPPHSHSLDDIKSNTVRVILKFFKPDVVDIDEQDDKKILKEILSKPIDGFKFLTKRDVNFIKTTLMVSKIEELLDFKEKNIFNFISTSQLKIMERDGIEVKQLIKRIEKAITISSILVQLRNKNIEMTKEQQKIIVAGLDKAGKTAILQTFGGRLGIDDLTKLKPTKRVHRREIKTKDMLLYLWDFGGQTKYRHEYLKNPGSYFLSVDLLIYVIDVQDYERYDESFSYLEQLLGVLKTLEENPNLLILIHKLDPDVRDEPEVQLNVEFLKENLKDMLMNEDFDYEIYLTSIYTFISREPKFTKFLKEMVTQKDLVADPTLDKIEELGKIVNNSLNAIIKLSERVTEQFNAYEARFIFLEKKLMALEFKDQVDAGKITDYDSEAAKQQVLKSLSKSQGASASTNQISLNPADSLNPPPMPKLNPPPTAPVASSSNNHGASNERGPSLRGTIIQELKDLFTKVKEQKY